MRELNFKNFQQELFSLFLKINSDFQENSIFWWAHSGTLLGLIRDKGIIPWDDDIDMAMSYKHFLENKEKIEDVIRKYNLSIYYPKNSFGIDVAKLISNDDIIVVYKGEKYKFNLTIDIMLSFPNKRESKIRGIGTTIFYCFIFLHRKFLFPLPKVLVFGNRKNKIHIPRFANFLFLPLKLIAPRPIMVMILNIFYKIKLNKKNSNWEKLSIFNLYSFKTGLYIYDLKNIVTIDVKGNKFFADGNWEEEFKKKYGNWKNHPAPDKQYPHHLISSEKVKR